MMKDFSLRCKNVTSFERHVFLVTATDTQDVPCFRNSHKQFEGYRLANVGTAMQSVFTWLIP